MKRIDSIISALEAERAETERHLAWLDKQLTEFRDHAGDAPEVPKRATRRQTAKRASSRRATARSLKRDVGAEIVAFLGKHPGSTAGDVAKALSIERSTIAPRLSKMVKTGEISKADRGYSVAK